MDSLGCIVAPLIQPGDGGKGPWMVDAAALWRSGGGRAADAAALSGAFLTALAGPDHPHGAEALAALERAGEDALLGDAARLMARLVQEAREEFAAACRRDEVLAHRAASLVDWLGRGGRPGRAEAAARLGPVFFPEGVGVRECWERRIGELRGRRAVVVEEPAADPVVDPARQLLWTANALLTIPLADADWGALTLSKGLLRDLLAVSGSRQRYWYDHPIPVGIAQENNELVVGLKALDTALAFEAARGNLAADARMPCVVSVSVTHEGLHALARRYIHEVLEQAGGLQHVEVLVFTEADCRRLSEKVLAPAAQRWLGREAESAFEVVGVDGEYGRHYSFLKAVAALWHVLGDRGVNATFKIDLDQMFPQAKLMAETGRTVLQHLASPLWGARGRDSRGLPVELGMLAGALVNQGDIQRGLFTPDVTLPTEEPTADETVFRSRVPQALSTVAEMMNRRLEWRHEDLRCCQERIHVTGGTTGIRVDALRRFRPFTPSFVGRAEDQAYGMSVLDGADGVRLASLHQAGLIMRHDKEGFAQQAMAVAAPGKLVGDYVRTLVFSAYARALPGGEAAVKEVLDPFTGCFISRLPITVVALRLGLKTAELAAAGRAEEACDILVAAGARLAGTLDLVSGSPSPLKQRLEQERHEWRLFYDTLDALEAALQRGDPCAADLRLKWCQARHSTLVPT